MTVLALAAKATIAVLLLAAGGAKLADPAGFATAVRLFVPGRAPVRMPTATVSLVTGAVIAAELIIGAASLCWPSAAWPNLAVLVLASGFTAVAGIGYARFRGRPCRCFGALTRRSFSARSLVQSLVIVAAALLAVIQPVRQVTVSLDLTAHLLLLAAAGLLTLAARTAAKALAPTEVAA